MVGEDFLNPSYYASGLGQLGSTLVSGAQGAASGLASAGSGFLSSITQPAPQYPTPIPQYPTSPTYTPSAPLSRISSDMPEFGKSFNMDALTGRSPSPAPSQAPSFQMPDILGSLGGVGDRLGGIFDKPVPNVPPTYQGTMPPGGALNLPPKDVTSLKPTTQVSKFDLTSREIKDIFGGLTGKATGVLEGYLAKADLASGEVKPPIVQQTIVKQEVSPLTQVLGTQPKTFEVPGELAKPSAEFMKTGVSGFYSDIGDTRTTNLMKAGTAIDTWSKPGEQRIVPIADQRDALEFQRQQSLATGDTRGARFYANELDKAAQNDIRLSSQYHYEAKETGLAQPINPYENIGDAALAFLKGGNVKDDFAKNYAFTPAPGSVIGLLPGGKGTQERDWQAAVAGKVVPERIENYLPAIAAWRAAGGTTGVYGGLGSRDQAGKLIPVPAENIAKLPEAYRLAFADIAVGKTIRPTTTYVLPGTSPSPLVTEPNVLRGGDIGSTLKLGGAAVTPSQIKEQSVFNKLNEMVTGKVIPSASAGEGIPTGEIEFASQAAGAPAEQLFVKDTNFELKESILKGIDPKLTALKETQAEILKAGAKGGYDAEGVFNYEYDSSSPAQARLHESIVGQSAVIKNDLATADSIKLTPYTAESAGEAAKSTGILGTLGGAEEWLKTNVTRKVFPTYESLGGALLKYPDIGVLALSGAEKKLGITPLYERENVENLLPSQHFLAYVRPEGFTKTVLDKEGTGRSITFGGSHTGSVRDIGMESLAGFAKGGIEMPREHPIETATWLAMPGAFKAAEGVIGTVGVRALPRLAASPITADILTVGKGALMTGFVGGEAAKVPGYSFDWGSILPGGKPFVARTIEGYDAEGKPIYAEQTPGAISGRAGELTIGISAMSAGTGLVAPYKFAYREKFEAPTETPLTRAGQLTSAYLESKLQPGVEKFYKLGDVAKVMTTKSRTMEVTEKPPVSLESARLAFESQEGITLPSRGAFGTEVTGITTTKPISLSERFATAREIWRPPKTGGREIIRAAGGVGTVSPTKAFEVQPGTGGVKAELKAPEGISPEVKLPAVEPTWTQKNLPTFSRWAGRGAAEPIKIEAPVEAPKVVTAGGLQFQTDVAQPSRLFARELSPLEQTAFERLVNSGKITKAAERIRGAKAGKGGVFAEKGSIGQQATEAAALGIEGKPVGVSRGVGDIDVLSEKPEIFNRLMRDEIKAVLTDQGFKNVNVKLIYPEGTRFSYELGGKTRNLIPERFAGVRNYANRAYEISAKSPDGKPIKYTLDSSIDLKIWGMDQPLAAGEGRYNIRSLFTPAEERSSGLLNTLFLTPGKMAISMPKSVGETLFGPSTFRQKYKEDYLQTRAEQKYVNPMESSLTEPTTGKPTTISRLYSTFTDKMDNIRQTSRMSLSRNPSAIEENTKFGKSVWDANNIYTKFRARFEENLKSGKMSARDRAYGEKKLADMETNLGIINAAEIEMRMPSGKIQRFKVQDLVDKYDAKVKASYGGRAIEASPRTMSPVEAYEARILTSGRSAAVQTPAGLATVQISKPGKIAAPQEIMGSRNFLLDKILYQEKVSAREAKGESKVGKSGKMPASVSASSGIKLPGALSSGLSGRKSLSTDFASLASVSFGGSKGVSSGVSPAKSEGSGGRSKGPSGSSSYSSSSIYGSSSVSSGSESSSSGSGSSSSIGGRSSSSYGRFGAPFLAPPGGGGGAGGGRGRGNIIVKNPLAALKVASEKKFKMMFDFSRANKLAFDVSKEIQQTQPYGTSGATASFARGASASIKEAMAIKRRLRKTHPKIKSKN